MAETRHTGAVTRPHRASFSSGVGRSRLSALALVGAVALLPWSRIPPVPGDLNHVQWSDGLVCLAALLWAGESIRSRRWPDWRVVAVLSAYAAASTLSFLVAAPKTIDTAGKWLGIVMLCAFAYLVSDAARDPRVRVAFTDAVMVNAFVVAVGSVVALALFWSDRSTGLIGSFGDLRPSRSVARVQVGAYHPALLGSWTIAGFAVVAGTLPTVGGRRRGAYRMALLALLFICTLTISRELVGLAVAMAWWRWGALAGRARHMLVVLSCASALAVLGPTFVNIELDPGNPLSTSVVGRDSYRKVWAESVLDGVRERPLFGVGPGTPPGDVQGLRVDAHFTPLNVAGTQGLVALAAFLVVVISAWRCRDRSDLALTGALIGLAITALAIDLEDFRHVWLALGLALAGTARRRSSDR